MIHPDILTKITERFFMSEMKLEKAFGESTCTWCFAKDETVLRHDETDTYWHEDCFEAAGDTIHHIIGWLPPEKKSRA